MHHSCMESIFLEISEKAKWPTSALVLELASLASQIRKTMVTPGEKYWLYINRVNKWAKSPRYWARGNDGWGPGTTVNPVDIQFTNLGRPSWHKRLNHCMFEFPAIFLHFCNSELAQFMRGKRVLVPNQGRGSDLDGSADLWRPYMARGFANFEHNFEF